MAWGQEKGADVKISALPVSMRFFDFVPCSLPLKTLILLTSSMFSYLVLPFRRSVFFLGFIGIFLPVHHFESRMKKYMEMANGIGLACRGNIVDMLRKKS